MKTKRLECVLCGTISVIQRKNSKDRPAGHIKHMYCPRCKVRRPHAELDEFREQFNRNMDEFDSLHSSMVKYLPARTVEISNMERGNTRDTEEVILQDRKRG